MIFIAWPCSTLRNCASFGTARHINATLHLAIWFLFGLGFFPLWKCQPVSSNNWVLIFLSWSEHVALCCTSTPVCVEYCLKQIGRVVFWRSEEQHV